VTARNVYAVTEYCFELENIKSFSIMFVLFQVQVHKNSRRSTSKNSRWKSLWCPFHWNRYICLLYFHVVMKHVWKKEFFQHMLYCILCILALWKYNHYYIIILVLKFCLLLRYCCY